jgi:hypothetical protein
VDAVFRKCALADLGDTPAYDTEYHYKAANADAGLPEVMRPLPVAWSLIAVYAPRVDAPRHVRLGWSGPEWTAGDPDPDARDADASKTASYIHTDYFGVRPEPETRDVVDLGDMAARPFARVLGLIDRRRFQVVRLPPCFADGRGKDLHSDKAIGTAVERARRTPPTKDHWLLGVLPWKLFEIQYLPVQRRAGFLEEVLPLIQEVHRAAAEACASPDPDAYVRARAREKGGRVPRSSPSAAARATVQDVDAVQSLFDALTI